MESDPPVAALRDWQLELAEWLRFVTESAHLLAERPGLVFQQAFNQPKETAVSRRAEADHRAGRGPAGPWLRWVNRPERPSACLMTLPGLQHKVTCLTFARDNGWLLAGDDIGNVSVWNVTSGAPVAKLDRHRTPERVAALAVSSDGLTLHAVNRWATLWSSRIDAAGKIEREINFTPPPGLPRDLAEPKGVQFLDNGDRVALSYEGGIVSIADVGSGAPVRQIRFGGRWSRFSPDESKLAGRGEDTHSVVVYDVATGREVAVCGRPSGAEQHNWLSTASWSPDGRQIAVGYKDGSVKVFDADTGEVRLAFQPHTDVVMICAWSADGRWLLTNAHYGVYQVGAGSSLRVWDAATGAAVGSYGDDVVVTSAAVSADGRWVATGSMDAIVRVWDAANPRSGRSMAAVGHAANVRALAYGPDGRAFGSAGDDAKIRVWDAVTGDVRHTLDHCASARHLSPEYPLSVEQSTTAMSCAFSPDGTRLAAAASHNSIAVWDVTSGAPVLSLDSPYIDGAVVAFTPDGSEIVCSSRAHALLAWRSADGTPLEPYVGHEMLVHGIAVASQGPRFATASYDGTAALWDTARRAPLATFDGYDKGFLERHGGRALPPPSIACSPDGEAVATALPGRVRFALWSGKDGHGRGTFEADDRTDPGRGGDLTFIAFSADSRRLVGSATNGRLYLWDVSSMSDAPNVSKSIAATLVERGHRPARSLAIAADGRSVATGDEAITLWDAERLTPTAYFWTGSPIRCLAFSPDGARLIAAGGSGAVYLLEIMR